LQFAQDYIQHLLQIQRGAQRGVDFTQSLGYQTAARGANLMAQAHFFRHIFLDVDFFAGFEVMFFLQQRYFFRCFWSVIFSSFNLG
jgi:hypothetical protein